jgi:trehalose-6-phosphate synthase
MAPEERQERMGRMRTVIREHNIYLWAGSLISELAAIKADVPGAGLRRLRQVVGA